jgi:hypothetical protein
VVAGNPKDLAIVEAWHLVVVGIPKDQFVFFISYGFNCKVLG